ncbi:acyl-CoA dehydrogenase family protein [Desulfocastanea catecholica]
MQVLRKAFDAGMIGSDIPKEFGGQGLSLVDSALITEEIAAACPGLATSIFDSSLGMEPILLSDNIVAKNKYLTAIAKDFKLAAFATSEPTMGSNVAGIRCLAKADGEDYILNGTKYWVTNGGVADYLSVFATIDPKSRNKGICAFLWKPNGRESQLDALSPKWASAVLTRWESISKMSACLRKISWHFPVKGLPWR